MLRDEPQPNDLTSFVDAYWLKPLDGRSDKCLRITWTGAEPWGEAKLAATATERAVMPRDVTPSSNPRPGRK